MSVADLALQRNKYKHLSDAEWHWFLQQIEGRERTADKLPTFASIPDWWYPVRLSCEQCSSEAAAKYKAAIVGGVMGYGESLSTLSDSGLSTLSSFAAVYSEGLPVTGDKNRFADLTGGYGVDTYFLSELFDHTDYVEQNAELCRIAEHNFDISRKTAITIHNCTAEEFLSSPSRGSGGFHLIFIDPARRDSHGSKVFRIEDCTPNVVELLPTLLAHSKRLLIKLSPMLDLTQAVTSLSQVNWDIHIVAIKNEVKEVLLLSGGTGQITTIDLAQKDQAFVFTREEEQHCGLEIRDGKLENYLYEPNAAILKAGAYKLVAQRFGLHKLDVNTHLYTSRQFIENFPGRVWRITEKQNLKQANVLTRNYPLTPEQLKKKLHLRDGGSTFVIGCRIAGKPTILLAERI